jgi:hypothetical protein
MARLLYVLTGLVTAIPVVWALGWAVWGAGVSVAEYLSLLGSLLLVASGVAGHSRRRVAARVALVSTAAIWSFYLPGIAGVVKSVATNQELSLTVLLWTPSASPLVIEQWKQIPGAPDTSLSPADISQIESTGISGTVSVYTANGKYGKGKQSRVILIMQAPVSGPVELKEPDATSIVYLQEDSRWSQFPPNAPTLSRRIRIAPQWDDPRQSSVMVELSTGSAQGFGVWWPKAALGGRSR